VMVEIYRQREAGVLDFADTVYMDPAFFNEGEGDVYDESYIGAEVVIDELLYNMVTLSSNVAAYALLELAGTENINATMIDLGLISTEIRWSPIANAEPAEPMAGYAWLQESDESSPAERADEAFNVTTADDMALLFQLLLEGSVVSSEASAEMLELLDQQQVNYLLPAGLPEDVVVAHKTGTLPGLIHDCGVIYTSSGPVVVAVLIESDYEGEAVEFTQEIAGLAYAFAEQYSSS
jgi:beta-lactamase class A